MLLLLLDTATDCFTVFARTKIKSRRGNLNMCHFGILEILYQGHK
jgi:hypothetical protein